MEFRNVRLIQTLLADYLSAYLQGNTPGGYVTLSEKRFVAQDSDEAVYLTELCFWLFLVNAVRARQDWFRSSFFRTWTVGSVVAVVYMPLITIFTRSDPLKVSCPPCEVDRLN